MKRKVEQKEKEQDQSERRRRASRLGAGAALQESGGGLFKLAEVSGLSLMQGRRGLRWQVVKHVCTGSEGVGAMRDHGSRDVGAGRESLGPQISQHGVGPPASERGDGIVVHPGT